MRFAQCMNRDTVRKEKVYREWRDGVFNKVQSSVAKHIEGSDHKVISRNRRERYQNYLNETNTVNGVFLGKTLPKTAGTIHGKVSVGRLHDPTLRIVQKRTEELQMVNAEQPSNKVWSNVCAQGPQTGTAKCTNTTS